MSNQNQENTTLQRIAESTNYVVTPANALDAVALAGAFNANPRLNTWPGIAQAAFAYSADLYDGVIARSTGTSSELGTKVDTIGDKIKIAHGLWHIVRMGLADKGLITVVAAQNIANAGITVLDRIENEEPRIITATTIGKRAMATQVGGISLQVIGTKLTESHPRAGKTLKRFGSVIGYGGFTVFGIPSTLEYWKSYKGK